MNTTKTSSAASDEIDLLALFKVLKSSYLKIGFFTLFFIVIGAAYSFLKPARSIKPMRHYSMIK
ncbi:Wzz/FepE/Etk N-terminal domain-containing protein [Providencia hangzhouensis]